MAATPPSPPRASPARDRRDRCPGVLRPWLADDGALLRVRLIGGRLRRDQLAGLVALAARHGDGTVHLTARANVQLRGVPVEAVADVVDGVAALGLLPSRPHERVRNVLLSPLTGRIGGRADLRRVADRLDAVLCADPCLAALPARFLFALDDRGDLARSTGLEPDLALVALGHDSGRLHAAGVPGPVLSLDRAAGALVSLARRFLDLRGDGPAAAWHVAELEGGPAALGFPVEGAAQHDDGGVPRPPYGTLRQDDGRTLLHLDLADGTLVPDRAADVLTRAGGEVVVTPWRSIVLPDLDPDPRLTEGR